MVDFLDDFEKDFGAPMHEVLDGAERKPPKIVFGKLVNGEDLTQAGAGATPVPVAPGPGGNRLALDDTVELVHMSRVHRDKRGLFHHAGELSDLDPKALDTESRAHGLMYRAALEREVMLLGGLVRSFRRALDDSLKQRGVPAAGAAGFGIGSLLGLLGDLAGGPGSAAARPAPEDLDVFLTQVAATAQKLDQKELRYAALHDAGRTLHVVRSSYRKYLVDKLALANVPRAAAAAGPGLLAGLPGMSAMPPEIGFVIAMLQKWPFIADELFLRMLMQCQLSMAPAIEAACGAVTLDALRKHRAPVYPPWWRPNDTAPGIGPLVDETGISELDGPLGEADAAAREVIDFLSLPVALAPGSPFLDQAFQAATPSGWLGSQTQALAKIVAASFVAFFGKGMPVELKDFVTYMATFLADFLREIYARLLGPAGQKPIYHHDLVASARLHLVSKLIDGIIGSAGLASTLGNGLSFNIQGIPVNPLAGLVARLKELLAREVVPCIEPAIPFAMRGLAERLNGARRAAAKGHTMEAYLAELPAAHALLFQNVFFPLWDRLAALLFDPVSAWLGKEAGPLVDKVGENLGVARGWLDDARNGMLKASKLYAALKKPFKWDPTDPDADDPFKPYEDALGSEVVDTDPTAQTPLALQPFFPSREDKATAAPVADAELARVRPLWQEPVRRGSRGPARGGGPAAPGGDPATAPATPGGGGSP
ncbi:MAG: hypothetical protein IT373_03720 [Polyangiaceae bacterium]|nr:hypothetical protein [Polyangiaceae bacterium]